jgi:hypothetical protein
MDQLFDLTGSQTPVGRIPPNTIPFLKHDIRRLKLIHQECKLLHVNWSVVKEGLTLLVRWLIHQIIKVHMVHDDKASCSCCTKQQIDFDLLLAKKKADAFIWHNNHSTYIVAFTEDVSKKIHQKAQARLGVLNNSTIIDSVYSKELETLGTMKQVRNANVLFTWPTLALPNVRRT